MLPRRALRDGNSREAALAPHLIKILVAGLAITRLS